MVMGRLIPVGIEPQLDPFSGNQDRANLPEELAPVQTIPLAMHWENIFTPNNLDSHQELKSLKLLPPQ